MKKEEIDSEIRAMKNLLQQNDYTARQVAFEVARLVKEIHPDKPMPVLDKYIEMENKADTFRARINELENMEPDPEEDEEA